LYERAVLTHTYARLLSKWDKRELAGEDMKRDADMLFESVLGDGDGEGGGGVIRSLGAMVSYPIKL
jgi:hypothetical protein